MARVFLLIGLSACGYRSHPAPVPAEPDASVEPPAAVTLVADGCDHEVTFPGVYAPVDAGRERYGKKTPQPLGVHLAFPVDPSTTIAFSWRTDVETLASTVEIGTSEDALDLRANGWTWVAFEGTPGQSGYAETRLHEVHVCGLAPGTRYFYRVGGDDAWSDVWSFKTAPAPGDPRPIRFAVLGDTRGAEDGVWARPDGIADSLDAFDPDFVVHTGDATTVGYRIEEWTTFFRPQALFTEAPLLFAWGNHEVDYDELHAMQDSIIVMPGNEDWWALRYGDLQFVGLLDWPPEDEILTGEQSDFLREALCGSDAPWKFAMHHRPPYGSGLHYGPQEDLQEAWSPIFDDCGLDMDFAGHDHVYDRSMPIRGGEIVGPAQGVVYMTVAGGGAPLYTAPEREDRPERSAIVEAVYSFAIVDVEGGHLAWRAYRYYAEPEDEPRIEDLDATTIEK